MDQSEPPLPTKRGKRRWWIAAGVALFLTAYAAMDGPIIYGFTRGWVPLGIYSLYRKPLESTIHRIPVLGSLQQDYRSHWNQLAISHIPKWNSVKLDTPFGPREVRFWFHGIDSAGIGSKAHRDGSRSVYISDREDRKICVVEQTRILFYDREIATIHQAAQLVEVEFDEGELEIDVDGRSIPINP